MLEQSLLTERFAASPKYALGPTRSEVPLSTMHSCDILMILDPTAIPVDWIVHQRSRTTGSQAMLPEKRDSS